MPGELSRQQAWLQAAILDPARAWGTEAMITPSPSLTPAACLGIYQQAYRTRLLERMRAHHPVLCRVLGPEVFDAFALDYLAAHPVRGRTLDDIGVGFADHLQSSRPDAGRHEDRCDLMVDIARFERAFVDATTAVGVEDIGGVDVELLPPPSHPGWPDATVTPAPCLRLLALDFPVHTYVTAVRCGEDSFPLPARARTRLALSRLDYAVTATELAAEPWWLLAVLVTGNGPRAAAQAARMSPRETAEWLRHWAGRGLFTAITVPTPVEAGVNTGTWSEPY
jgi:putative DNA-binding protein